MVARFVLQHALNGSIEDGLVYHEWFIGLKFRHPQNSATICKSPAQLLQNNVIEYFFFSQRVFMSILNLFEKSWKVFLDFTFASQYVYRF